MLVEIIGGVDYQVVGRLKGANSTGVVVMGGDSSGEPVFFPWERVMAMRPARKEDYGVPRS